MALGRPLCQDDALPDGSPVVVIGYGLWQREFGGESSALGKPIALAKHEYTIVGVAPKGFRRNREPAHRRLDPSGGRQGFRFAGKNWATDRTSIWMSIVARTETRCRGDRRCSAGDVGISRWGRRRPENATRLPR